MRNLVAHHYPTPNEVGIEIPRNLMPDRFCAGFDHGLKGGQLDHIDYFRRSFRFGFRAAKIYLRQVRRSRGIVEFPRRRMRLRTYWPS